MIPSSCTLLKAGLSALQLSGLDRAFSPLTRGIGAVLMLHHVSPARPSGFAPNGLLTITPQFLEEVVLEVRRRGFDIVSLDVAHARLRGEVAGQRPFACFTFDDGYRDNRDHAYPVLKRHGVPFTIYVASDFADGQGFLWWLVLERVVARRHFLAATIAGRPVTLRCNSDAEKTAAFERLYWWLRGLPEAEARAQVAALAEDSGIDVLAPCRELVMDWDELRALATDPLVTIGAHTVRHMALAGLAPHEAHAEIAGSVRRVEQEIGRPCRHFCYPYGDPASAGAREFEIAARLGLATAVTTQKGLIRADAGERLTGLPRVSLNGNFQDVRYVRTLLTGLPFALWRLLQGRRGKPGPVTGYLPSSAGASGFCIQRTSHAAGTTQASPPTM